VNSAVPAGPAGADAVAHVFVDALSERCELRGDDGHHLQRVRRLAAGARVTAGDGQGTWREYEVVATARGALVLEARGEPHVDPRPRVEIALAVALVKGGLDATAAAVTELGVARLIPLHTERSVVRWDPARAAQAVARLRTVVREAAMQSRRAHIPAVDEPSQLAEVVARPAVVVADRGGEPAGALAPPDRGEWTVVVGPEGGFSAAERAAFGACPRLGLGPHVLRAATAPVAAVAVLVERAAAPARHQWGPSGQS
jgi:16S rRNA (uracil1498-N3)-methyltransferase